jgi:hypothetical protein
LPKRGQEYKLVGCQNKIAKILTIDWFDAKIQISEEGIGINSRKCGQYELPQFESCHFFEVIK